jgi:hypothetical protein
MGFRVVIPGNKPELEFVFDTLLKHPLKGFEIRDPGITRSIGVHFSELIDKGMLDLTYNRRKGSSTLLVKTGDYRKIHGRGRSIEYILGDKMNNLLHVPNDLLKIRI